jgi:HK97 family phage major capsid protein
MDKVAELQQKKKEIIDEMRAILDLVDTEKRAVTPEEQTKYDALDAQVDAVNAQITGAEKERTQRMKLAEEESRMQGGSNASQAGPRKADPQEFRNIGEYFWAIAAAREGRHDARLDSLRSEPEAREQTMGTGTSGGFALPVQFRPQIWSVAPQGAIVRPRASVIPAGSPPDAKLTMPALDQTSAQNIYGGVIVTHTGEGVTMTETQTRLKEVSLEPKEISAYIVATNKLLVNWDAAASFINTQMNLARVGAEDYDFMRGNGVNQAMGFINCSAAVGYNRAAANAIAWADVYNMFARLRMGGNAVWIASPTIIPQLAAMVDAGNHAVWIGGGNLAQGASAPMPSTLMGLPVYFSERLPALGTRGDLNLVDLSYYLIKDGSGPFAAISTELLFLNNKTVFKLVWNVDAKPWLTEPIGLEGATTNTVSPFVVLV